MASATPLESQTLGFRGIKFAYIALYFNYVEEIMKFFMMIFFALSINFCLTEYSFAHPIPDNEVKSKLLSYLNDWQVNGWLEGMALHYDIESVSLRWSYDLRLGVDFIKEGDQEVNRAVVPVEDEQYKYELTCELVLSEEPPKRGNLYRYGIKVDYCSLEGIDNPTEEEDIFPAGFYQFEWEREKY